MIKHAAIALTITAGAAFAGVRSSGGPYTLDWYTIDGGGGTSAGGAYSLSGTIGQPDAAPPLGGGVFDLEPGFWPGSTVINACACDLDISGVLNFDDLDIFIDAFLTGSLVADLDGNGVLNFDDLDAFIDCFLAGCP